jgi:mannan endo-1,6-alpha-mannosidase
LDHTQKVFFPEEFGGKTLVEYACELPNNCNKDQRSFKGYLARWLAVCWQLAPFSQSQIMPWLKGSAEAAAKACTPTGSDVGCGLKWNTGSDDGQRDIGHQMTAQAIMQANLIPQAPKLADIKTGNSASNPNAGLDPGTASTNYEAIRPQTTGDRVGAWILTVLAILVTVGGGLLLLIDQSELRDYSGFLGASKRRWR